MNMTDEVAVLQRLSRELVTVSRGAAERLASLARALEDSDAVTAWAGIDPFRAIDVEGVCDLIRSTPERDPVLARVEQVRNVLTLLPILLTWLALFFAGSAYRETVQTNPSLAQQPFLLLWEQGFDGHAPGGFTPFSLLTLSNVAITDVTVIGLVVLMTGYIHHETNVKQTRRARRAADVQEELDQGLWLASMRLAQRVSVPVQQDQLRVVTEQLLDELRAERERIREVADMRTQELQGLTSFVKQFRSGARDLAHAADVLRANQLALVELGGAVYDQIAALTGETSQTSHAIEVAREQLSRSEQSAAVKLDGVLVAIDTLRESGQRTLESALDGIQASIAVVQGRQPQIEAALWDLDRQVIASNALITQALADDRVTSAITGVQAAVEDLGTATRDQGHELRGLKRDWDAQLESVSNAEQAIRETSAGLTRLLDRLQKDDFAVGSPILLGALRSVCDTLAQTQNSLADLQRLIADHREKTQTPPSIEFEPVYKWRLFGPAGLRLKQLGR